MSTVPLSLNHTTTEARYKNFQSLYVMRAPPYCGSHYPQGSPLTGRLDEVPPATATQYSHKVQRHVKPHLGARPGCLNFFIL